MITVARTRKRRKSARDDRSFMKTILINIFDYAVLKNTFMPPFAAVLSNARDQVRFVVLVPGSRLAEFSGTLRPLGFEVSARPQKYALWRENAALFASRNAIPADTVRQIQEEGLDGSGRLSLLKYSAARLLWALGHWRFFRSVLKRCVSPFFDSSIYDALLAELAPDLVFVTSTYAVDDIRLLRAARLRRIRTLGMIKSWDNLTSKDLLIEEPDRLIVHNQVVADEAVALHGYKREQISTTGVPQFDWYADPSFTFPRGEFFSDLQLDPKKKLITYTAMGRWLVRHERDIIALLYDMIKSPEFARDTQLLVRMHPAYPDAKEALQKDFPGLAVDVPGRPAEKEGWKADWRFSTDDVRQLASTLRWSDVILNCGSTMMLDAACFDTPIIGIAFDGERTERSYWRSSARLFEREHCKNVVKTGGVRVVCDRKELTEALEAYLADPTLDREGRARLVKEQSGTLGEASRKLGEVVLSAAL